MKYIVDHDYHIHSYLSACAKDPEQTAERIVKYAKDHGLKSVCVTDHFWDREAPYGVTENNPWQNWCYRQDYTHISQILPLPKDPEVEFLFGCETDMDMLDVIGLPKKNMDRFDFIIIAPSHLHMEGFGLKHGATLEEKAEVWVHKHETLLNMKLPFHKIGLAHMIFSTKVTNLIPDDTFRRIFTKAAEVGVGIEMNFGVPSADASEEAKRDLRRPYILAKECGCKFYLGSDTHQAKFLDSGYNKLCDMVDFLGFEESDKFILKKD